MLKSILVLPDDGTRISSGSDADVSVKSCTTTECVNSGAELTIGSTCCACLEVQIITKGQKLGLSAGQLIELHKADDSGNETKVGTFRLEMPTKKSDNVYKVTAYDRVADLDKDLSAWLKGLTGWPYDLIAFAGMVCETCGLTLVTTEIPNGNFPVQQFYKAGVTGRRLMEWICEIACRFCRANADGDIEFGWYANSGVSIQPTGDRYYFAGALTYEDYDVAAIDEVQLRLADSDSGALWPPIVNGTVTYAYLRIRSGPGTNYGEVGQLAQGDTVRILEQKTINGAVWGRIAEGWICITGYVELETAEAENPYIITGNAILMAKVTDDLLPYLQVIRDQLAALPAYKPCKVSLPAGLDVRPGDVVQVTDKHGNAFTTCVMTKTQAGQRDTLECTGSARRGSSTAANSLTAAQITQQAVENQTHEETLNRLTKNGAIQGIYVQNDKWYINAELVTLQNLKVKAADITGVITVKDAGGNKLFTAGEGAVTIAGWDVDESSIRYGNLGATGSMWLCRTGTTVSPHTYGQTGIAGTAATKIGWCIAVGNKFGVDNSGGLFAKDADISGKITASSGKIGVWSISTDNNALVSEYVAGCRVEIHSTGVRVYYYDTSGNLTSGIVTWRELLNMKEKVL